MSRFKNNSQRDNGEQQQGDKSQPPVFSRKAFTGTGVVECAVWSKVVDGDNGEREVFNITVRRTYKEGKDYKSSNALRPEDALWAALFLQECAAFVASENSKR